MGNYHARCGAGEKPEVVTPEAYLSLSGQIPDFEKLIATIRSRNISADVILQNLAQLKGLYDKQASTIVGNCDTMLFLGSSEDETTKSVSEKVGKTTVDHRSTSTQKGTNGSYSVSDQIIARELITPAEVGLLPRDECLLFINGVKPFKSKKYKIETHKNYKYLSDSSNENVFDIEKYKSELAKKAAEENQDYELGKDFKLAEDIAEDEEKLETDDIIDGVSGDIEQ